ncbi:MAG: glucose-1-phosphate cytidylyltransferase, partial [Lachnospiraceae bacterium]|nr:glucose-1-phosphate cytidylyltransferase [Lachnospiraceae bacterium]
SHGRTATITTTRPEGRFGAIKIDEKGCVESFKEKARKDQSWVNAGFMVLNRNIFDYLGDGTTMLEDAPFERLASEGEMMAYRHDGFWSPMDNIHDRSYLETLWEKGEAPWKIW